MMSGVIDALVAKRKELGLSQAALAERTGMKQSAVARIESKRISPTLETFVRRWDSFFPLTCRATQTSNKRNEAFFAFPRHTFLHRWTDTGLYGDNVKFPVDKRKLVACVDKKHTIRPQ